MTDKAQLIAAIDQFRLEIARAAQYAALLDKETDGQFSVADDLVSVAQKIGAASEYMSQKSDDEIPG